MVSMLSIAASDGAWECASAWIVSLPVSAGDSAITFAKNLSLVMVLLLHRDSDCFPQAADSLWVRHLFFIHKTNVKI